MKFFQDFLEIIETYREPRRLASSNVALLAALMLSLFIGYKAFGIVLKERAIYSDTKKLETQTAKIKEANDLLESAIAQTNTPEVIEKLAKEQLSLQKSGELVVVIIAPVSDTDAGVSQKPSLWQRFKSLFSR
ncbi:MAG: septum formation initiator family protein [bacterium]|nr:septum formation initiator family protein [bacterium]